MAWRTSRSSRSGLAPPRSSRSGARRWLRWRGSWSVRPPPLNASSEPGRTRTRRTCRPGGQRTNGQSMYAIQHGVKVSKVTVRRHTALGRRLDGAQHRANAMTSRNAAPDQQSDATQQAEDDGKAAHSSQPSGNQHSTVPCGQTPLSTGPR